MEHVVIVQLEQPSTDSRDGAATGATAPEARLAWYVRKTVIGGSSGDEVDIRDGLRNGNMWCVSLLEQSGGTILWSGQ